ncbi:sporozoite developmental protein [Toxoplasma gondii p89]|uniref:Sporozoite developmental protein n=1 Tax=Toxoplasma gondii p89 TaxID=943119 RepID=A0A086L185_TOXGO|nr:sporozoite developmental protein [Toxoplasma gondii p89]
MCRFSKMIKKLLLVLCSCVLAVGCVCGEVLKPGADYRDFHHFQLPNGMQCLAIHHPKTTEGAYSVAVNTGSLYDPEDLPGLAHFLEHMLFLGTSKHPEPESYDKFMSERGGQNNAYTDEEKTVFFNQVSDKYLEDALDRFSQFFKSPLFNPEYEEREAHAVDSEHQKNVPNDEERTWFTIRSLGKGPLSRFATGNLETLNTAPKRKGINVVRRLKDFHKKYYCASNMAVVIMSPRSLVEQETLLRGSFEDVTSGNPNFLGFDQCPGVDYDRTPPFDLSNTGKFIHLQSVGGESSLWVAFSLPPTITSYKKQPTGILTYLFEYSGDGSLSKRLRTMGLADEVSVVADRTSVSTLFAVKVDLTSKGASERGAVLEEVFSYINLLKNEGVDSKTISSISEQSLVDFHTSQPDPPAMNEVARLAHNLLTYEPYHVLAGDSLLVDPDAQFVNQLLDKMTSDHAIIAFADPQFKRNNDSFDVEPFYGIEYKITNLPKEQRRRLETVTPSPGAYKIPPALKHVPRPEDLHLLPALGGMSIPELLGDSNTSGGHAVWWQGQGTLPVPRVHANIKARTQRSRTNMASRTQATLLMAALAEQLDEETVDLKQCGISHSVGVSGDGLFLAFAAYTPKQLRQVMAVVASKIQDPQVEQDRFDRIKQRMIEELEDSASQVAYEHAIAAASVLLRNDANSRKDLLRLLKSSSTSLNETLKTFRDLKAVHADAFIMGNIDKADANSVVQSFLQDSGFTQIPMKDAAQSLVVDQRAPIEALIANPIPKDVNHATVVQYQLGVPSIEERVNLAVLGQMINRRLFDRLRTEEQLGYIVGARSYIDSSVESLRCVLEGSRKHPDEIADLIDKELWKMNDHLQSISDGELDHWKESARAELEKPTETFYEEFGRSWGQIANHGHCFNKRDLELIYLNTEFNRKQLSRTYTKLLEPSRRLVVKLVASLQPAQEVTLIGQESLLDERRESLAHKRSKGQKHRKGLTLENLDEETVSQFHNAAGFYPQVTVCELSPRMLLRLEEEM